MIDPGSEPLTVRLREEIESLGLEVMVVADGDPAEPLESRARVAGAVAAIRITRRGSGSVDMTIVDRATGKTVSRHLPIATGSDPASSELVATRTVELLRASLMELEAPHPARGDVPATPEVRALAAPVGEPRVTTLAVAAGPALVTSPALGVSVDVWVAVLLRTQSGFGATARLVVPGTGGGLDIAEGHVSARAWQYRLGAVFEGPRLTRSLSPHFEAGATLVTLTTAGAATAPFRGVEQHSLTWGPWIAAGLRYEFVPRVSLVVTAELALLFPETVIRSDAREVATFGRPLVGASTGLEVAW
ncbi:MAG TPA: hypothetical protein VLJ38_22260 [Polyangiaceae bacterium]|nr:hypothetical protein [Polyangiaceae bacterium]